MLHGQNRPSQRARLGDFPWRRWRGRRHQPGDGLSEFSVMTTSEPGVSRWISSVRLFRASSIVTVGMLVALPDRCARLGVYSPRGQPLFLVIDRSSGRLGVNL